MTKYQSLYIEKHRIDNETLLIQKTVCNNPILHFGPLKASLSQLFEMGFHLQVLSHSSYRNLETLYLARRGEQYKICRRPFNEFLSATDFSKFVKEKNLSNKLNLNVEYKAIPEIDPWKILKDKYPPRKKQIMVGNQTLKEYVYDILS